MSDRSREYGEGGAPIPAIDEPTVIFMINKSLRHDSSTAEDVYQATRCSWIIGNEARERAFYALGVSNGVVRGAYRIERWRPADGNRWCFDGRSAAELDVIGKSVGRIKGRKGASNPVRIFLDGIPAPTPQDQ
ncbi:MAG: hypothetical protein H0W06_09680 [Chloroflexia bacterium]|nr:hypothetical protein [Chloroflexia bacterium]